MNSNKLSLSKLDFKKKEKWKLLLFIIIFFIPITGFPQIEEEEEIIKDFVIGLSVADEFRLDEARFTDDTNYFIGLFIENEIKHGFTNEIYIAKSRREGSLNFNIPSTENLESGYLDSRSEMKEESISIREKIKYRFFNRDVKPFIGIGIGFDFVYNTSNHLKEYRGMTYRKDHSAREFITLAMNSSVGIDWYVFEHMFLSLSLDGVRIFGYSLENQFPTLKGSEIDLKREPRSILFLKLGVGYNFYR